MFGGHINCVADNYVYMRAPDLTKTECLNNYTLMPMHMRSLFTPEELRKAQYGYTFSFTKGCPLLKVPGRFGPPGGEASPLMDTYLFDICADPFQNSPAKSPEAETMLETLIAKIFNRVVRKLQFQNNFR